MPVEWKQEVIDVYDKWENPSFNGKLSRKEEEILKSAEYSFYQAEQAFPSTKHEIDEELVRSESLRKIILEGAWNTKIHDWLCELFQNAFDLSATKCKLTIREEEREIVFGHNGRQIEGVRSDSSEYRIGDVTNLIKMGLSGKRFNLHSEGRFGVGFKYWMRHFSNAQLIASGFDLSWDSNYSNYSIKRTKYNPEWTIFKFTGNLHSGENNPVEKLTEEQLERVITAIKLRNEHFYCEIKNHDDTIVIKHKIEPKLTEENRYQILSCQDIFINAEDAPNVTETTIMKIPLSSEIFSSKYRNSFLEYMAAKIEHINVTRTEQNRPELGNPDEIATQFLNDSFVTLGFFHEEGEEGHILSMFPISRAEKTSSRISFDAPFHIKPSRLELFTSKHISHQTIPVDRNSLLLSMMMQAYGYFLQCVQENKLLSPELINHLLNNPPGEGDSLLDNIIKTDTSQNYICPYTSKYRCDKEHTPVTEIVSNACWPNASGELIELGPNALILDPILRNYQEKMIAKYKESEDESIITDLRWLDAHIVNECIIHGTNEHGCKIPVTNWLLENNRHGNGKAGITIAGSEKDDDS
jgi:hypothetical protein